MRCYSRYFRVLGFSLIASVAGVLIGFDAPRALTQETAKKLPVPDQAAQAQALAKIQAQLKEINPKTKGDAVSFLIKQAGLSKIPAEKFVCLQQAATSAAQAGDLGAAYFAIEELGEHFQMDMLPQKGDALKSAIQAIASPDAAAELVDQALKLVAAAVDRDNYDLAISLGQLAEDAARKSKDLPLVLSVQRERKGIVAIQKQFLSLKPFLDRLEKDPADAEANLHVGTYYCLLKGDWERGLFLLAQSNDNQLKLLAQRDLINPEALKEQIAVGDGWWDFGDKHAGQVKLHLKQRASYWYQQAQYGAEEALQTKLEERIALVPFSPKQGMPWDYSGEPGPIKFDGKNVGNIFGVAFSPDGKLLASAGSNGQAVLWEAKTGKKVQTLAGHGSTVWGVAFDPKGKFVYTSCMDGIGRKWETLSGKLLQAFPPNAQFGSMYGIAVSPDGKKVLTAFSDGTVRLFDAKTGQLLKTLTGHNSPVYAVAFFPNGNKALTGGGFDHKLIVWDLEKGTQLLKIHNPGQSGRAVAVSPDGTKGVATGEATVRIWELNKGQEIQKFQNHTAPVYAVAFSPNGKRLLTGGLDATLRYWDVATGQELKVFPHNTIVQYLAFSPGGGRAVSGGPDGTVRLWGLPR